MSKTQTPDQFTEHCRSLVAKKQDSISQLRDQVAAIETRLAKFSDSPSIEGYEAAVKDQTELSSRKALVERIERSFHPERELDLLLNTPEGKRVLDEHLSRKSKFIDGLREEARKLRAKALTAEERNDDSCHDLNQKADDLLDTFDAGTNEIKTAGDHIKRMAVTIDSMVNFRTICDRLDSIV